MKNEKILELLTAGKLDELKRELVAELSVAGSGSKNTAKAFIQLSKQAEKEQRNGKNEAGGFYYCRPGLAGAWIDENGRQNICDGFWAVQRLEPLAGVVEVPRGADLLKIDRCYPEEPGEFVAVDFREVENALKIARATSEDKKRIFYIKAGGFLFNAGWAVELLKAFDTPEVGVSKNILYIKGREGRAILLPVRETADAPVVFEVLGV